MSLKHCKRIEYLESINLPNCGVQLWKKSANLNAKEILKTFLVCKYYCVQYRFRENRAVFQIMEIQATRFTSGNSLHSISMRVLARPSGFHGRNAVSPLSFGLPLPFRADTLRDMAKCRDLLASYLLWYIPLPWDTWLTLFLIFCWEGRNNKTISTLFVNNQRTFTSKVSRVTR